SLDAHLVRRDLPSYPTRRSSDLRGALEDAARENIGLRWIERIEADFHFLTGQMGGSFIEALLKQECGIAPDQTVQAIEEQATDIGRGRQLTDPLNIALPTLKRRGIGGQAAVGGTVIGGLNPGIQTRVEILHAGDLFQIQAGQKLVADAAEEAFDFSATFGLVRWRMDNQNT